MEVTGERKSGFSIGWNRDDTNRDDNNKKDERCQDRAVEDRWNDKVTP